jgi:hypothetical protein
LNQRKRATVSAPIAGDFARLEASSAACRSRMTPRTSEKARLAESNRSSAQVSVAARPFQQVGSAAAGSSVVNLPIRWCRLGAEESSRPMRRHLRRREREFMTIVPV